MERSISSDGTLNIGVKLKGRNIASLSCEDLIKLSKLPRDEFHNPIHEALRILLVKMLEEGGTRSIMSVLAELRRSKPKMYQGSDEDLPF